MLYESEVVALSIGLPNPNEDLLEAIRGLRRESCDLDA